MLKQIFDRLLNNLQTTIEGVILIGIAYLTAHGVTLSADNASRLTGLGALAVGALVKLFSKDPPPQESE